MQNDGNVYEGIAYQTMEESKQESGHLQINDCLPLEDMKIHIEWKSESTKKLNQMTDMRAVY
ncbi:hypothetical protein [Peribacillus sp. NPDC097895]|uniref:hypothetical protein n=1 Tax=Peribacillus sp. NPDC097895 TaxID=3390619 RepID=UPI003D08C856